MSQVQRKIFDMLMESQFWPPETMLAFQRNQLTQLLHHARAHVPFYKSRLNAVFRKNGSIDWDRWCEIPITTRADVRDRSADMYAAMLPPGHGKITFGSTSGSSGIPISVRKNELFRLASKAAGIRFSSWIGMDWTKSIAEFPPKLYAENEAGQSYRSKPSTPAWVHDAPGEKLFISRAMPEADALELLRTHSIEYISSLPNFVEMLAHANLALSSPVTVSKVLCYGMHALKSQAELFKKSFGADTYCSYSSEETARIAVQCELRGLYHINAEQVLVEILDDGNGPCPKGVAGRVVVTAFYSTAQPLIRYEIGDIAEFGGPCHCGRTLPTLSRILGRLYPIFIRPNGDRFWVQFNHEIIARNLQCKSYQIAQTGPVDFEVRYVPHNLDSLRNLEAVRSIILKNLGFGASLQFKSLDQIPVGVGGKPQILVREYHV
jgi:phenylacetate-CoA ligase